MVFSKYVDHDKLKFSGLDLEQKSTGDPKIPQKHKISALYQSGITLNRVTWIRDLCLPDQGYGLPGSGVQKPRSGLKCKQNLVIFGKLKEKQGK